MGFPGGARGKEPTCKCSRYKRRGSVPGSERCPGVGNGSPGQNSCLGNSTDRGAHSLKRQSSVSVVVLCPILCDPMDCSLRRLLCPGDFPARILEWVAISFWGIFLTWDPAWVSRISYTGRQILPCWATRERLQFTLWCTHFHLREESLAS